MDLGVRAQGLEVANAYDWPRCGLLVQDAARAKVDVEAKPTCHEVADDLKLDRPHKPQANFLQVLVPGDGEHGVLLGKLSQGAEHRVDVGAAREHAVGEDGRQGGTLRRGFDAQHVSWANARETRYGTDAAGGDM